MENQISKNPEKPTKDRGGNKKKSNKYIPKLPDKNNKNFWVKALTVVSSAAILYLIFGYGAASSIEIKEIKCSSKQLQITSHDNASYTLPEYEGSSNKVYASKIAFSSQEDIYEVYLFDSKHRKISFRVSKTKVDNANSDKAECKGPR